MANKVLDSIGLTYFWGKIKAAFASKVPYATEGGIAILNSEGNIDDSGYTPEDFAQAYQAVPDGGTTGQVLAKASDDDNDVEWIDLQTAVSITYSELNTLRDGGDLVAGTLYRITDYTCTTVQENTQSAGHVFDILVYADDESHLNENAKAAHHQGDTYFAHCKLEAWELKYCLDNDTNRFAWADSEGAFYDLFCPYVESHNVEVGGTMYYAFAYPSAPDGYVYSTERMPASGDTLYVLEDEQMTIDDEFLEDYNEGGKGVVYYMKDELGNECPYDFKNIMFKRKITLTGGFPIYDNINGTDTWVYTFCGNSYHITNDEWSELKDGSLESPYGHMSDETSSTFHDNKIGEYILLYDDDEDYTKCGKLYLNNNVFLGYWEEVGSDDSNYSSYHYAYCCYNNTLGDSCHDNTFGSNCCNNYFVGCFFNNTFGIFCSNNTFGTNCSDNTFGTGCSDNTFGTFCSNNTFGDGFSYNSFGTYCYDNTFGTYCSYNSFGSNFHYNSFGDSFQYSSFENNCSSNTFGNYCQSIIVFDGVQYCSMTGGSSGSPVKNAQILNGTKGTSSSNKLTIAFTANKNYTQIAAKDANGTLKIWSAADKQDTLVSGTNIKTINNQSLLGSGNLTISGGSSITFRQW